jgi:hypothetical protein
MTIHPISRTLRALGASIAALVLAGAIAGTPAHAQDAGQWVLWKGSDQPGGDRMYVSCLQNGQHVVDLSGLKSFSEYVIDGKVNRVRFKYSLDSDDDVGAFRIVNVTPELGTLCQWGMAD